MLKQNQSLLIKKSDYHLQGDSHFVISDATSCWISLGAQIGAIENQLKLA